MKSVIKLSVLFSLVGFAFFYAWLKTYNMSSDYFEFAEAQAKTENYTTALKGMNKLELRRDDVYLGGYQQVIETWEEAVIGFKPDFYYEARNRVGVMLGKLNEEELMSFIEIYVELDMRYVPEAAAILLSRATLNGDIEVATEMDEFLQEAFPRFYRENVQTVELALVTPNEGEE
ncbi:putative exported protein precursor [Vibrio ishigakensis]|uniref:Putative exported protein n=1 Tax=Vibrio ishigakensis TaxID=1481914 RepID=A0A0B8NRM6_9VIBR|nr:hypothetical protein [Vibrio ishigakensis]GAM56606.1 putative exported protein precursor [Vibrio ishigakensis]